MAKEQLKKLEEIYKALKSINEKHTKEARSKPVEYWNDTVEGEERIEWMSHLDNTVFDLEFAIESLKIYCAGEPKNQT